MFDACCSLSDPNRKRFREVPTIWSGRYSVLPRIEGYLAGISVAKTKLAPSTDEKNWLTPAIIFVLEVDDAFDQQETLKYTSSSAIVISSENMKSVRKSTNVFVGEPTYVFEIILLKVDENTPVFLHLVTAEISVRIERSRDIHCDRARKWIRNP